MLTQSDLKWLVPWKPLPQKQEPMLCATFLQRTAFQSKLLVTMAHHFSLPSMRNSLDKMATTGYWSLHSSSLKWSSWVVCASLQALSRIFSIQFILHTAAENSELPFVFCPLSYRCTQACNNRVVPSQTVPTKTTAYMSLSRETGPRHSCVQSARKDEDAPWQAC